MLLEMLVSFLYICGWVAAVTLCYIYAASHILVTCYALASMFIVTAIVAYILYPCFRKIFNVRVKSSGKAVLVTGCDTGFGHELAKRLASKGFKVFAACFSDNSDGALTLREISKAKMHVIKMDVRSDADIKKAVAYVKSNIRGSRLWAVVNNAGIFKGIDLLLTKNEDYTACWDTNTMGVVRVTKAFLPLLMESEGRVITVTSLASRLSSPHVGPYSMSKFATRAFCEVLRQEIRPWGIKVIEIEPDFFRTALTSEDAITSKFDEDLKLVDDEIKKNYDELYFEELKKYLKKAVSMRSNRISKVINALEDAVSLSQPKLVYKPCRNVFFDVSAFISERMPKPLFDAQLRLMDRALSLPSPKKKFL